MVSWKPAAKWCHENQPIYRRIENIYTSLLQTCDQICHSSLYSLRLHRFTVKLPYLIFHPWTRSGTLIDLSNMQTWCIVVRMMAYGQKYSSVCVSYLLLAIVKFSNNIHFTHHHFFLLFSKPCYFFMLIFKILPEGQEHMWHIICERGNLSKTFIRSVQNCRW